MRITKISASMSGLDNEKMQREILASPPPEKALALLNHAYGKRNLDAFETASENPKYVNNLPILKLLAKIVSENATNDRSVQIVRNILEYSQTEIEKSVRIQLNASALTNPQIASVILLLRPPIQFKEGLTINQFDALTSSLITNLNLTDNKKVGINHPVLEAMMEDLKAGNPWNNCTSAYIFVSNRLFRTRGQDEFMVEASKYDFDPVAAVSLINTAKTYQSSNPKLYQNVKQNENPGITIAATCANKEEWENADPDQILPKFIEVLQKHDYQGHADAIWDLLKTKMTQVNWELKCFQFEYNGDNIIDILLNINDNIMPELIEFISTSANIDPLKRTAVYGRIIHEGLNNPAYRDKILAMPPACFRMLRTSPEDAEIIRNYFTPAPTHKTYIPEEDEEMQSIKPQPKPQAKPKLQPKPKEIKPEYLKEENDFDIDDLDLDDILSSEKNWYIKYSETQELLKEAGWKENIATGLAAAIMMVFQGATPAEASKVKNVDIVQLENALQSLKNKKSQPKRTKYMQPPKPSKPLSQQPTDLSMDDLFDFISNNEGYKRVAYLDPSKKNMVIGVGCNVDTHKEIIEHNLKLNYNDVRRGRIALTDEQIRKLFNIDVQDAIGIARRFVNNFDQLPTEMKKVLVDMSFNIGEGGIQQFKKLKAAVEQFDFKTASNELRSSKWYTQVKNRGIRSADLVASLAPPSSYPALAKL